ncbi:AAA family ATPase [Sphingomonas sp. AR_OL41]|uniref:AAA family ATPase n=1 Tax=Sphingomonas sp. AR_OL41 TaxID=3042729 RepID=UPI0024811BF9|nr:AAA family ATPase [Sphingomonas sp. AR_OL41]MDH7971754.1 AAA family ATPase [Sphingomonas sp. AR_OL41]
MNDPENTPIHAEDEITWMRNYRATKGLSWTQLSRISNIPSSTLSLLLSGKYTGNVDAVAKRVFGFRQKAQSQEERALGALTLPDYVETRSSRLLTNLLGIAHTGRLILAAMGPGTSKTMTARHYKGCMGDTVWMVTMRDTTGSTGAMIRAVMRAMALQARGPLSSVADQIIDRVAGTQGLLIVDEANHLERGAIEELRGWHDVTGIGIALLGNEELALRIKGGANRHAYARLESRMAACHIQDVPTDEDVSIFLDACDIDEPAIRKVLIDVGTSPQHGGLREVHQILQGANMLAIADEQLLGLAHVQQAKGSRFTQQMRRAS